MTVTSFALETERLILTRPERCDFDDFAAMRAEPEVMRYITGIPATPRESWERLIRYRGFWDILGYGFWIVRSRETGRFVGTVGFGENRRGLHEAFEGFPEAGWLLASWCHGQGFGSEAVSAACAWLDSATRHKRSVCMIDKHNAASLRLAQCNGYAFFTDASYMDTPVVLMARQKP